MDRPRSTVSTMTMVTERTEKSVTSTSASTLTPAHKTWSAYQGPVIYTGPNGLRNQRVNTMHDFVSVGEYDNSSEITSQIGYLNRPPPGTRFPKAKNGQVGEIGWVFDTLKLVKGI